MSYLEELFKDGVDNFFEFYKVALNKIKNLETLISEKNKIIEELKSIIYTTDCMLSDDPEGEAGASGLFLSDDSASSFSSE